MIIKGTKDVKQQLQEYYNSIYYMQEEPTQIIMQRNIKHMFNTFYSDEYNPINSNDYNFIHTFYKNLISSIIKREPISEKTFLDILNQYINKLDERKTNKTSKDKWQEISDVVDWVDYMIDYQNKYNNVTKTALIQRSAEILDATAKKHSDFKLHNIQYEFTRYVKNINSSTIRELRLYDIEAAKADLRGIFNKHRNKILIAKSK